MLKKSEKQMLVISKYALDCLPYNIAYQDVTWKTCTLRKWLNKVFIKTAFNKIERQMIMTAKIENRDNEVYRAAGGGDTKDKAFLLSQLDVADTNLGFSDSWGDDVKRRCAYAWDKGMLYRNKTYVDGEPWATADGEPTCEWWLRSPATYFPNTASFVGYLGALSSNCYLDVYRFCGVRPAMFIKL